MTEELLIAEPPAPQLNAIYFGPNGLRAGWGILMFLLLLGFGFMGLSIATQVQHLARPTPEMLAHPFFTPKAQLAEDVLYIAMVVCAAFLFGRRSVASAGKAALVSLLLAVSVLLLAAGIFHVSQVQKQKAAEHKQADMTKSPPSSAPAANAGMQESQTLVSEAINFGVVLLVTFLMSRIERRNFGEYGLGGNSRRWPQLAQGLMLGFTSLSLLVLGLYLGHWITFGGFLLHGAGPVLKNGILWLIAFTFVGFFEEFAFRGYLQYTLARGIGHGWVGFFAAALLFNFGFGFLHGSNPGESIIGLWTAGLIGFVFCISLWYTRSLWWAIGFHATWDWGESYFYGTADSGGVSQGRLLDTHPQGKLLLSGGTTGPEGSALCLVIIAVIVLLIWATLRHERSKSANQALVNPSANA